MEGFGGGGQREVGGRFPLAAAEGGQVVVGGPGQGGHFAADGRAVAVHRHAGDRADGRMPGPDALPQRGGALALGGHGADTADHHGPGPGRGVRPYGAVVDVGHGRTPFG
ncbi:hypothetical protein BX281_10810 [Streptomyces sp. Ag82_O1-15]|nr:hypothetical protein BX281_10810 [Streptomyces sp. Ag82_O1-15]